MSRYVALQKKLKTNFCLQPTAEVSSNYLSCSSVQFANLHLGCTSGVHFWVHFWFKSGRRPRTSPGLVTNQKTRNRIDVDLF